MDEVTATGREDGGARFGLVEPVEQDRGELPALGAGQGHGQHDGHQLDGVAGQLTDMARQEERGVKHSPTIAAATDRSWRLGLTET